MTFISPKPSLFQFSSLGSLIVLILFLFPFKALTGQGPYDEADYLFNFALHTFDEGDWCGAAIEFQRFFFLYPNDPRAKEALYLSGLSYRKCGKWEKAIVIFRQCTVIFSSDPISRKALLQIGETYYDSGRYDLALSTYHDLIKGHPDSEESRIAIFRSVFVYLMKGNWEEAISILEKVDPLSPCYEKSIKMKREIEETAPLVPRKSPSTAGILSAIIPGGGHFYSGMIKDGLTSFFLNAIFISGAIIAFRNDMKVTGAIISFLESGWYIGGIQSAQQSARRYNEGKWRDYLKSLEERSSNLSGESGNCGLFLFSISF